MLRYIGKKVEEKERMLLGGRLGLVRINIYRCMVLPNLDVYLGVSDFNFLNLRIRIYRR